MRHWRSFRIAGEPVPEGRPRWSGKFMHPCPETAAWKAHVRATARAMQFEPAVKIGPAPRVVPLRVDLEFYLPGDFDGPLVGKPDKDNLEKTVLDGLTGYTFTDAAKGEFDVPSLLWEDDAQVVTGTTSKFRTTDPDLVGVVVHVYFAGHNTEADLLRRHNFMPAKKTKKGESSMIANAERLGRQVHQFFQEIAAEPPLEEANPLVGTSMESVSGYESPTPPSRFAIDERLAWITLTNGERWWLDRRRCGLSLEKRARQWRVSGEILRSWEDGSVVAPQMLMPFVLPAEWCVVIRRRMQLSILQVAALFFVSQDYIGAAEAGRAVPDGLVALWRAYFRRVRCVYVSDILDGTYNDPGIFDVIQAAAQDQADVVSPPHPPDEKNTVSLPNYRLRDLDKSEVAAGRDASKTVWPKGRLDAP